MNTRSAGRVVSVLKNVQKVKDHLYSLTEQTFPVSVEEIQSSIQSVYNIKIDKFELDYEPSDLLGLHERWEKTQKSVIVVIPRMEVEKSRFYATKEMCHVVVDRKEDRSVDGPEVVQRLLTLSSFRQFPDTLSDTNSNQLNSEALAEMAALEFLYPFEMRVIDRKKWGSKVQTRSEIAQKYKLPEFLIDRVFYKENFEFCREALMSIGH